MSRTVYFFVIAALLLGLSPRVSAQSATRSLTVTARMETGHLYYEIVGTGFAPGERVRLNARNELSHARMVFRVETEVSGSWRVFIGRNDNGTFYQVTGGTWRIRARAGGGDAKTTFTAPGDEAISEWGGDHVQLRIFETGAVLEYDCGHGSIDVPFVVDGDGRFDVAGVHVFEHGGPVYNDEVPDAHAARYTGQVEGKTMTFTLSVPDRGVSETFSLVRDAPGSIVRCY